MESLSVYLKTSREKRKITLEKMAAETRISLRHLKSIEDGQYKQLPGGMYNRAFIRSYCEHIGIDPVEALIRFDAETAPPKEKPVKPKPIIPQISSPVKPHPLVTWSVMLVISVAGLFFSRKWIVEIFSPYFSHPPTPALAVASKPAPPPSPQRTGSAVPPAAPEEAGGTSPGDALPPPPAGAATSASIPTGTIRLEFEVLQQCWVSVDQDGNRVLVKILKPGDDRTFDASQKFYLILGNAGGVRLKINGRLAKPLGKPGEVVRVLINEKNIKDLLEKS